MSDLTATRTGLITRATRTHYRLSQATTTEDHPTPFEHLVLSLGREGDTCVFPADGQGRLSSLVGFGYGLGMPRWLTDAEMDAYVAACITQHEADGGAGLRVAPADLNLTGTAEVDR
ncbi:hypothetical protein [Cellulomonas sp.]|uniref:hypothetical protein n=1 Tax=Cellulomonas sp. TaxID=40001 RepID=UPI001B236758|nr:hypothetical protein [Cellulomonas sp.]MBO9555573.1 hypothetical protein [Cellulomonas sp.]